MSRFSDSFREAIERRWYGRPGILMGLSPLEWLFRSLSRRRRQNATKNAFRSSLPVIVVGNISVGGTGKTPTIIRLAQFFNGQGLRPGVVSRGYGRESREAVHANDQSTVLELGDEPFLIYQSCHCELVVSENRIEAIKKLESLHCDVILSDDGLQHYHMGRELEIVVVDGERLLGNQHLLPVGPLRESANRLSEVDFVLVNLPSGTDSENLPNTFQPSETCFHIGVKPQNVEHIKSKTKKPLEQWVNEVQSSAKNIVAIAGLGNPNKFFKTLAQLGVQFQSVAFPDHHVFKAEDFKSHTNDVVIMTEKDAVKCREIVHEDSYALGISMDIPDEVLHRIMEKLQTKVNLKQG